MSLQSFQRHQLPVTPWKNGGGSTCELACWPPGAGLHDFGWRISIASIAAAGPFSVFPGIDRSIMLLAGNGVQLRSADGDIDHRLGTPGQPFAFSGDTAIDCTLLGDDSRVSSDFNVMTRRGQWRAEVQVLTQAFAAPPAPHGLLLILHGQWQLNDESSPLPADSGLCWTNARQTWQAQPASADAQLVLVSIHVA